jgi:hypothetical protein
MSRLIFRILIGITLAVMAFARSTRGGLPVRLFLPFHYWFVVSIFVFGAFGLHSAWRAWRDPLNRRAWLFDVLIAAAWVPYWLVNVNVQP